MTPGKRLGSYEIVAPLGAGGMGDVYRARDARLDRKVAIKILSAHLDGDPDAVAPFEREALSVAKLSHPNIVAIDEFGRAQAPSRSAPCCTRCSAASARSRAKQPPVVR